MISPLKAQNGKSLPEGGVSALMAGSVAREEVWLMASWVWDPVESLESAWSLLPPGLQEQHQDLFRL